MSQRESAPHPHGLMKSLVRRRSCAKSLYCSLSGISTTSSGCAALNFSSAAAGGRIQHNRLVSRAFFQWFSVQQAVGLLQDAG